MCRSKWCHVFFGGTAPLCTFFIAVEGYTMDLNYFKDTLFDIINESDALDAELLDIYCDDQNDTMTVNLKDGSSF